MVDDAYLISKVYRLIRKRITELDLALLEEHVEDWANFKTLRGRRDECLRLEQELKNLLKKEFEIESDST